MILTRALLSQVEPERKNGRVVSDAAVL